MINLLPPEQKEELFWEEKLKLVLILGIVILAFLISLTLILFPIKALLSAELEVQKIYFEQRERELENPQIKEVEEKIKNLNLALSNLNSFYQRGINLTLVLEKISKTLPMGTFLTSLNFNSATAQISLSGFSPDREALLEFKENLEKEEKFSQIYFPSTSWVEPTDINFSVSFKLK